MSVLGALGEGDVEPVELFVAGLAALPADHRVALRREESRRPLREPEGAGLPEHPYASRFGVFRDQVAEGRVVGGQVPFDVQRPALGILAVQHGAHGRVVDPGDLDAVQDVGVAGLLRFRGDCLQAGVVRIVGLQAEPRRLHEGAAVIGDAVAKGPSIFGETDLEPAVRAAEHRQEGEQKCGEIHGAGIYISSEFT